MREGQTNFANYANYANFSGFFSHSLILTVSTVLSGTRVSGERAREAMTNGARQAGQG